MARLWADILKLPQVGVTDNFFELGGNSILSLKVVARLRQDKTFGIEIKLRDLLQKPTIRALLAETGAAAPAAASAPSALLPLNAAVRGRIRCSACMAASAPSSTMGRWRAASKDAGR